MLLLLLLLNSRTDRPKAMQDFRLILHVGNPIGQKPHAKTCHTHFYRYVHVVTHPNNMYLHVLYFYFIYYFEKDIKASNNIVTLGEVALHHPGLGDVAFFKKIKKRGKENFCPSV